MINLVNDLYNENGEPIINGADTIGNHDFRKEDGFFDFLERFFNTEFGYDRNSFPISRKKIQDVYENPDELFFYYLKNSDSVNQILLNKNFKFSNDLINCLKTCDNIYVVFQSEHESDDELGFVTLFEYLDEIGVSDKKVFLVNGNYIFNTYNEKYNRKINHYRIKLIPSTCCSVFSQIPIKYNTEKKGKFFICFNRTPKYHRYVNLVLLKNRNLLDDVNWSLIPIYNIIDNDLDNSIKMYGNFFSHEEMEKYEKDMLYINSIGTKKSDYEEQRDWIDLEKNNQFKTDQLPKLTGAASESGGMMIPEDIETHENSYVNIITESQFKDRLNCLHISEKSFRPFAFYQIPLILASNGHIKKMKEIYDFDFFDDIIDHSYNDEPDQMKRHIKFIDEVERINKNKEEVKAFYNNNQQRFEENRKKIMNIQRDDSDYNFFKSFSSKKDFQKYLYANKQRFI